MNNSEYIRLSLELHLFFDRIMKEHSIFLETSFMEKDSNFRQVAKDFQKIFSDILKKVIYLADGNVSNSLINSNELVTKNTIDAEAKTSNLSESFIDTDITLRELNLKSGSITANEEMINNISIINNQTLPLIDDLIKFKSDILNNVNICRMYTTNYQSLINHIMNEAKMYYTLLSKIESRSLFNENELYEQEIFWNNIMKEHAEFIRGLLDPIEQKLILTADKYAKDYEMIIKNYSDNLGYLTNISLSETINFRDFKIAGEEGILKCKIKSIIIPLLADHVVREANHFIRILESVNT